MSLTLGANFQGCSIVLRARGPDLLLAPGSCGRPRPQPPSHRRSHPTQDAEDELLFADRVAGLDIAKAGVEVTIRVPSDTTAGRRQQETRTYGTTRAELESLGDSKGR